MYLVGQMAAGYIFGRLVAKPLKVKTILPLLLFCGTVTDADVLLKPFGIQHETWSHSVIVLGLIFIALFSVWRRRFVPYAVAVLQETIFGDGFIGSSPWFYPFSRQRYGLGFLYGSDFDVAVESLLTVAFMGYALLNGDLMGLFKRSNRKQNLTSVFPFATTILGLLFFDFFRPDAIAKYMLLGLYYFFAVFTFASLVVAVAFLFSANLVHKPDKTTKQAGRSVCLRKS